MILKTQPTKRKGLVRVQCRFEAHDDCLRHGHGGAKRPSIAILNHLGIPATTITEAGEIEYQRYCPRLEHAETEYAPAKPETLATLIAGDDGWQAGDEVTFYIDYRRFHLHGERRRWRTNKRKSPRHHPQKLER